MVPVDIPPDPLPVIPAIIIHRPSIDAVIGGLLIGPTFPIMDVTIYHFTLFARLIVTFAGANAFSPVDPMLPGRPVDPGFVVVDATVHSFMAIETLVVHPTVQDRSIHNNISVTAVHVCSVSMDMGPVTVDPTGSRNPTVVVDTVTVPVAVIVQPGPDGESDTEGDEAAGPVRPTMKVYPCRIVDRNVEIAGMHRPETDVSAPIDHLHLCC